MRSKQTSPVIREGDVAAIDPRMQRLMDLCGITELPPVHTMTIPLERIVIPHEALAKPSARFIRNVDLLGIRQPPSVAFVQGTAWDASDARYEVLMGRRRIATARYLTAKKADPRFAQLKCEVYEWQLPKLTALLGLAENDQRSPSWVEDVLRLRQLIQEDVVMTLDELAEYGFHRRMIKKRLEMAFLPPVILEYICTGTVKQAVALQILRLKETQRMRLEAILQGGEALTADLVQGLLKRQINQGMAVVHTDLSQYWENLAPSPPPASLEYEAPLSVEQMRLLLSTFDAQILTDPAFERARMLIQVLLKELEIQIQLRTTPIPALELGKEPVHA